MSYETLDNVFNVNTAPVPAKQEVNLPVVAEEKDTVDTDFDIARNNYLEILEQGKAAINTAMLVASQSENPRAIEVLSGLLKNMADINKQLVQMSKDKNDAKGVKSTQPPTQIGTVQQAVFVGNAAELNKMISAKLKEVGNV